MTVSAVVFDLFHTLVDLDASKPVGFHRRSALARAAGLDTAAFEEFWEETLAERETTTVDVVDLVERRVRSDGRRLTAAQRLEIDDIFGVGCDHGLVHPDPEILSTVATIAATVPVSVLSNCYEREIARWVDSPLRSHVRVFGCSSRIGVAKPDDGAYRWVIERLAIDPARSLYVGNGGSDELDGARRAGFGTVVHTNVFDGRYSLVPEPEQRRRAETADESVGTVSEFRSVLTGLALG